MFQRQVSPTILIRQFEHTDAETIFAVVQRDRAHLREWLPWVDPTASTHDVHDFIGKAAAQWETNRSPNAGVWMDGQLAGCVGCHEIDYVNRNASIGYWLASDRQGQGIITQCCTVLLDYLFSEIGLHRVELRCGTENFKSAAIAQRLGFTREGELRAAQWVNDRWLNLLVWSILEDEWRQRAR